jgi:hypothetical protein
VNESLLRKAFEFAPYTSVSAIAYGLEHSPKFTLSLLNGLMFAAASDYQAHLEERDFANKFSTLMADCGPWQHGPETARRSRASLDRLPATTQGVTLLDPYYFDHSMIYSDDSYCEGGSQLFSHAYRLHPCGVFALNYDPRREDDTTLVDAVLCMAYLRGTDLWGKPLLFNAMWKEGLPLGSACAFKIPRWGTLRRALEVDGKVPVLEMLKLQCEIAVATAGATKAEIESVIRRFGGAETLPTPVERGFPNLTGSVWFGSEPFPALSNFEYELVGADYKQRRVSVPLWFRPARGV